VEIETYRKAKMTNWSKNRGTGCTEMDKIKDLGFALLALPAALFVS